MSVEPNKWGVIYNPKAGTRKVQKRWKEINAYIRHSKKLMSMLRLTMIFPIKKEVAMPPRGRNIIRS